MGRDRGHEMHRVGLKGVKVSLKDDYKFFSLYAPLASTDPAQLLLLALAARFEALIHTTKPIL